VLHGTSEYLYSYGAICSAAKKIIEENLENAIFVDGESCNIIKAWFDEAYRSEVDTEALRGFICSFSQKGDQLSQWRAYCPSGNGISIGFNSIVLTKLANKHEFKLVKCIYGKKSRKTC